MIDYDGKPLNNGHAAMVVETGHQLGLEQDTGCLDHPDIRPTPKRYLILGLFCVHSMVNALQWIYLASLTNLVGSFYQVSNMAVNWTSMIYMVMYIPLVVPASWLFERLGMRNAILLGSLGTSLGALIKCASCQPDRFQLLMFGQTLVAISQLFVLSVPPRLASVWFPDNQVSLANACGIFGNQLGIALGFVVPQLVLGSQASQMKMMSHSELIGPRLWLLFAAIAFVSCSVTLLIALFFDSTPKKAPGLARLRQIRQETHSNLTSLVDAGSGGPASRLQFGNILRDLLSNRNFLKLIIGYGLNVGVFYAISTILNQMISPEWPSDSSSLAGRLGLIMVVSGMFGAIGSGFLLDKSRKYRLVNGCLYLSSFLSMLTFTLALVFHSKTSLYVASGLLGTFMTSYLFIGYEMSNEITWPLSESVSAGLLNLAAQIFGVLLTLSGSMLVDHFGHPVVNLYFSMALLVGLFIVATIRLQLKRQNAISG